MIQEYFSLWRQHVNIGVAVLLSCLVHLSLITAVRFQPYKAANYCCQSDVIQLSIKLNSSPIQSELPKASNTKVMTVDEAVISDQINPSQISKKIISSSNHSSFPVSVNTQSSDDKNEFKNKYYATPEVDIKALPITDLDATLLNGMNNSGLPIRLRVYINAYGNVIKVDKISGQDTDEEAIQYLTGMLKKALFIAAKKDGLNVNSYQEIEFSFIPQPP